MPSPNHPTRRTWMTSLASLPWAGSALATAPAGDAAQGQVRGPEQGQGASTLVAYFSRSGNTRVVAGLLERALGAELFEIRPAVAYPAEYLATVEQARQERDRGVEPVLAARVAGIAAYRTIYLGFPIWGETAPPIVRSFLSAHDLTGKTLIPFVTHGGYGTGDSESVLRRLAPAASLRPGFVMQADQERQTMDRVNGWLAGRPGGR